MLSLATGALHLCDVFYSRPPTDIISDKEMLNDCDSGNETNQETVEVDNERKSYIVVHKQDASKKNRSLVVARMSLSLVGTFQQRL